MADVPANTGAGVTGFSSLARGVTPTYDYQPFFDQGTFRQVNVYRPSATSPSIPGRTIDDQPTVTRTPSILVRPPSTKGMRRTTATNEEPTRVLLGTSPSRPQRADDPSYGVIRQQGAAADNPGVNQGQTGGTPLDYSIDDLFKGNFGLPVKGSADKAGEFVYVPPAGGSSGSNSMLVLLLLAGLGVGGYFLYQKFKKGD